MVSGSRPLGVALVVVCFALRPGQALAQAGGVETLPEIVVTADRKAEPISRSGSAISVVSRETIGTFNPSSFVDVLRNVPGLDITETGGPGATTNVRIRGANTGQTLVLIDGIRVNDPATGSGDFDFATLLPTAVERIEVLRGPQTSLYGSDAIGGVVSIFTRQGDGAPRFEARTEAGSYGTLTSSATASGTVGPWSYAFSGGGQKSDGFSRYGYRVGQLERKFGSAFEADGFSRYGGYGRIGYDAGEGVKLEIGALSFRTLSQYDAASSTLPARTVATGASRIFPDTPNEATRQFTQIFARGTAEQGPLTHTLTVFANQTDRTNDEVTYSSTGNRFRQSGASTSEFRGDRIGTEYQGDLKLDLFGTLTFGGKYELEKATTFSTNLLTPSVPRALTLDASQSTRSLFGLYQLPIGERLVLTAGARHDEVNDVTFDTWRTTGAFLIPETGSKLRASAGTGGKAPTLFQLFSPQNGNADLSPEKSFGWDAGIDQTLFEGRATISATAFGNRFKNLISFDATRGASGSYINTARAETSGVEIEGALVLLPETVRLTSAYTYLHAKDLATGLTLQRRPQHVGRVGVAWTPLPGLLIEPRVTFVARRFSGNNETLPLPRYGRLDIYSEYRLDPTWKVFGRIENVTDARYQEVLNYGTTGRAAYAGLSATW